MMTRFQTLLAINFRRYVTVDTALTSNQVKIYLDGVDQTDDTTSPNSGVSIGNGGRD
jgi:hypothetical protein